MIRVLSTSVGKILYFVVSSKSAVKNFVRLNQLAAMLGITRAAAAVSIHGSIVHQLAEQSGKHDC
jgi:hypothetical protein